MMMQDHKPEDQTAIRTDLGAIFVSLELSRSTWLVTSLAGWRGEDVKTFCSWRRHFGAVDAVLAAHREGP